MEEVREEPDYAQSSEPAAGSSRWRRALLVAVPFGLLAAALSVVSGTWALNHFGPQPTDGNFVLDQPGVYSEPAATESTNPVVDGRALPTVELVDSAGDATQLVITRPTIINVWFSTCAPCERELPDFAAIDAAFGNRIDIVGVDPFDTVDTMLRFADDRGVQYRLLRDPEREFTNALGVVTFPVTLFVNADGVIVKQLGLVDEATLRANIEDLFPEAVDAAATTTATTTTATTIATKTVDVSDDDGDRDDDGDSGEDDDDDHNGDHEDDD